MAEIAITQAAFAGFTVLRRKPWAPLLWSTLYAAVMAALLVVLGGAFVQGVGRLTRMSQGGAQPPPQAVFELIGGILGGYLLFLCVFWVLGAVVNMAVVRSVLAPEASAFGYLRLGARELWLLLANFVLFILYMLVSLVFSIPVGIITALTALNSPSLGAYISWPIQLVTWIVTIWLGLRFCMVAPMIFTEGRFRLFESWSFTRGHAWRLFLVGLLVVVATVAIYVVLLAVGVAFGVPLFQQLAAATSPQAFFTEAPAQAFRQLSPLLILYVALIWAGSIVLLPVFFAPWPAAYRQLRGDDLAATFS